MPFDSRAPRVIKRQLGEADPIGSVYVGRGSKWGNMFHIGRDGTRSEVIAKYEQVLLGNPKMMADLCELRGRVLVCYCKPRACHGDVLLRLANR